jgi:hypothetical protein
MNGDIGDRPLWDSECRKGQDDSKRHGQVDRQQKADFRQHLPGRRKVTANR